MKLSINDSSAPTASQGSNRHPTGPSDRKLKADAWLARWAPQWEPYDRAVTRMARTVAGWATGALVNRREHPRILLVASPSGSGKTMLSRAAFRFWRGCAVTSWAMGHWGATRVPCAHWSDWSTLAETSLTERTGVWADAEEADLLVIDDVGAEVDRFRSGLPAENLRLMLERRHTHRGYTLITTNLFPEEWSERWDFRVTDRMLRRSHVVQSTPNGSYAQRKRDERTCPATSPSSHTSSRTEKDSQPLSEHAESRRVQQPALDEQPDPTRSELSEVGVCPFVLGEPLPTPADIR